jgi:hypothetical protein
MKQTSWLSCFCRSAQLRVVKVSDPHFDAPDAKFSRVFNGYCGRWHSEVRILPGQPAIPRNHVRVEKHRETPQSAGLLRSRSVSEYLCQRYGRLKRPIFSGSIPKYSRFSETRAGERVRSSLRDADARETDAEDDGPSASKTRELLDKRY